MRKLIILMIILAIIGCNKPEKHKEVIINAAASLTEGIEEVAKSYEKETGIKVIINLGGSGSLRKQVEEGAPVDFIFLASEKDLRKLLQKGLVEKKEDLLENNLVVIGKNKLEELKDITGLIAIGDPGFVPAGRYAKEALITEGIWSSVKKNILLTKDVRSALSYAERGEVDHSFVYKTDTNPKKGYHIYQVDKRKHSPIIYSAGVRKGSIEGSKFNEYLMKRISIFKKYGFVVR